MFHSEKVLSNKSDDLRSIPSPHAGAVHGDMPLALALGRQKEESLGLASYQAR